MYRTYRFGYPQWRFINGFAAAAEPCLSNVMRATGTPETTRNGHDHVSSRCP
jgi:hypothetical protein